MHEACSEARSLLISARATPSCPKRLNAISASSACRCSCAASWMTTQASSGLRSFSACSFIVILLSVLCGGIAVLTWQEFWSLLAEQIQRPDDHDPGVRGIDHVVDQASFRRVVGMHEFFGLLVDELRPKRVGARCA